MSPAYDINPNPKESELYLAINEVDASLDFSLAMEVKEYFQLKSKEAEIIKQQVIAAVSKWEKVAEEVGISRGQRELMAPAFNV